MALPRCFTPNATTGHILCRVHEGLTVDQDEAMPLVRVGLLMVDSQPSGRSGFELTEDGKTALARFVYSRLS